MKRRLLCVIAAMLMILCGCSAQDENKTGIAGNSDIYDITHDTDVKSEAVTEVPQSSEPTATPEMPTEAPADTVKTASIGFVGDIMIMQSQVKGASADNGGYDFKNSFRPMQGLFESVDLMCANLETPLAGEQNGGYSGPAPTMPPATSENANPVKPFQTFNAPDELAYDLKELGMDVLTTANNHCLDRGVDGLLRTVDVLQKAGLYQTGTFKSEEDREKSLIIDVNGIKVGIIAFSAAFNMHDRQLSSAEQVYLSRLYDDAYTESCIKNMRADGADYIVVMPHCGTELSHEPTDTHVKMFRQFAKWGADAIISSHPHVVQPIEFINVTREDGSEARVPIVYSMGNFISNMFPAPKNYGLYVRIDIEKAQSGGTVTVGLEYVPVYCIRQATERGTLHQVLPCYDDEGKIKAYEPLTKAEYKECDKCRNYVKDICGDEYLSEE